MIRWYSTSISCCFSYSGDCPLLFFDSIAKSIIMFAFIFTSTSSMIIFFFSSRRRHTRFDCDWSSDVCSSDLGVGNTTVGSQPDSAYGVRQTQLLVAPRVAIPLTPRLRFTVGPLLKYAHTPSDPGTVLAPTGLYYGAGDFGQVGLRAGLELDTRDHTAAPARGVHLSIVGQGYPAVWDAVHPFGSVSAEASTYLSAGDPPSATLALRAGGAAVSGTVPFQELVYVGGGTTVRGYAEQRFAGRRGAYGNVELRLLAGRLPFGDVGIFGLADVGRVWIPAESSDRWHAAAGGGLWLAWQHRRVNTLSIAAARSPERTAIYVRIGFMF